MKSELIKSLEGYRPFNEQEEKDKEIIIRALINQEDIFYRSNLMAHITASAWVVNPKRDKVLMAYHNIYNSWSWLGGHADGDEDLLRVALKEVKEESGLKHVTPVSSEIYSLEVLTVDGHMKHQDYVSSHLHLNLTYLIEATEEEALQVKVDENSQLGWFTLDKAVQASSEQWFRERIYTKLNEKLIEF